MSTHHVSYEPQATDLNDVATLELYGRCKALTLAAGASLLLERPQLSLRTDALDLADEAQALAVGSGRRSAQLAGIRDAALTLAGMLEDEPIDRANAIEQARLAQRNLRSQLGSLLAPQFTPCGAHTQLEEVHSA